MDITKIVDTIAALFFLSVNMILFFKYYHNSTRGKIYHCAAFFFTMVFGPLGFCIILLMREYIPTKKERPQQYTTIGQAEAATEDLTKYIDYLLFRVAQNKPVMAGKMKDLVIRYNDKKLSIYTNDMYISDNVDDIQDVMKTTVFCDTVLIIEKS